MKYLLAALAFSTQLVIAQDTASAPVTSAPAAVAGNVSGKVVETMNTAGYTYVLVDTGTKKVWAAAVEFSVKVGNAVSFSASEPMENYHSKSLNRDFDTVYFTGGITVNAGAAAATAATPALPAGHPPLTAPPAKAKVNLTGIKPAAGGQTVAEIFAGKAKLAGKSVSVRGKVVKYNAQIMGKNWLHLQDGSGNAANRDNDLAVTTATAAKVGDTVLVTGKVSANKDFGAGYKYDVILDDAQVTVE
jgi:hypothetical protein